MSPSPRRLSFAVGTSLLTASLATGTVGCDKGHTVNPAPPEDVHVNEGPEPEPEVAREVDGQGEDEGGEDEGGELDAPAEDVHVNTVPDPE